LAHPERYLYIDENLLLLEKLRDQGVLLQINALSFTGYYGKREKMMAEKMLDAGLIDFIGTDIHHKRHLEAFEDNSISGKVIRKIESLQLNNL
jgi:tyrosine-protein phosphatase YwqE